MARVEDGFLSGLMGKIWRKRMGIIKNSVCFHAAGPEYSKEFGLSKRDREKYIVGGVPELAKKYT